MLSDVLFLVLGMGLLLGGGDSLVRGASALAHRLGISPLVVGLTVVAFGTSAPELAVNVAGALSGAGEISFGNVMGSNIANVALVIGAVAVLRPIGIERAVIVREIPMMTLAAIAAAVMGLDHLFDRGALGDRYSRADGVMFLLLFGVFLYYTCNDALRQRESAQGAPQTEGHMAIGLAVVWVVLGLVGLVLGGHWTVSSASSLALQLGVSQTVVGLTVVAVGTSLPELVTSLVGVLRGADSLAVGNVVGSNIFNLLFVLGTTSVIRPVPVPSLGAWDLGMVILVSVALLPLAFNRTRCVGRSGGLLLLAAYFGYMTWRSLQG